MTVSSASEEFDIYFCGTRIGSAVMADLDDTDDLFCGVRYFDVKLTSLGRHALGMTQQEYDDCREPIYELLINPWMGICEIRGNLEMTRKIKHYVMPVLTSERK